MQERSATKRPYDSRGGVRDDPYYESKRPAMSDRYQYNVHLMCAATVLNGHLLSNTGYPLARENSRNERFSNQWKVGEF